MEVENNPIVSIIMPTYNRPDMLKDALKSIFSQTYQNFEIIVVNDGGVDVMEIIDPLNNEGKIKYIHTDIIGLSHARNIGCENAKGEIIAFIDDDAVATKGWLRAYVNAFTEIKPTPGLVGGKLLPEWELPLPSWHPDDRIPLLALFAH